MPSAKRFFISHASADAPFALRLEQELSLRGASVYRLSDEQFGTSWPDRLRDEMMKSSAFILIIPSQLDSNRNNIWFEAGAARALNKPVLAVLPPDRRGRREVPTNLADLLVLDADERPIESVAAMLLQAA